MKKRNITKMLILPALLISGLSACGYGSDGGAHVNEYHHNYGTQSTTAIDPEGVQMYNANFGQRADREIVPDRDARVARIAMKSAQRVPEVSRATAVAMGTDIVIGIEVDNTINKADVERKVYEKVKVSQPSYNLHITSDDHLSKRVQTLYERGHQNKTLDQDMGAVIQEIGRSTPLR
ncbi:hypothetical protein BEP19_13390 [Ammoniphilus oxalaticus]|uniref:Sporulation protein n=1 Tax=Ammoniphilus oxalaticus TaxID=66863 RepID=A0A419SFB3_9BACL|nr:YhcN/YlaJ family sporulation lipoprotein [Ammoniphilus oxalaticus]RKD22062.1 hypothetical protein BEP19_13390 [Ammoniphilus oxalaticus]